MKLFVSPLLLVSYNYIILHFFANCNRKLKNNKNIGVECMVREY